MAIKITGKTSGNVAEVDADSNLQVTLPSDEAAAGFVKILDSIGRGISTTENGALSTSVDDLLLWEQVDGSALNTNTWTTSVSTMAIAQASGFITLNSAAIVTASTYAILQSIKYIPMYGHLPLRIAFNAKSAVLPEVNATIEVGIGLCAANAAPTDGAFFRWNTSGQFIAVMNNGGAEITSLISAVPIVNDVRLFEIILVEDKTQFFINDVLVAEMDVPDTQAYPVNAGRLPIFARVYTGGSAPATAPQLSIGQVVVVQQAMNQGKSWPSTLASVGRSVLQSPVTPFAQLANHANSTSPVSATLSNTAAGYATLGGRYQFAAVGAAVTDFALFAYQVPVGYQMYITGVRISAINLGAAVAVGATVLDWALGVNASAVSLATAENPPTTWAPRRVPLGLQGFLTLAAIGTTAPDINVNFSPPLVIDSGRFLHVILQVPVGTATLNQIIRGDVTFNGYFE